MRLTAVLFQVDPKIETGDEQQDDGSGANQEAALRWPKNPTPAD